MVSITFRYFNFILLGFLSHYPLLLAFVSAGICIISFFATLKYILPKLTDTKNDMIDIFSKEKSNYSINDIEQESPAIVLGSSGIYGIINGLGIVEALSAYAQSLSEKLKSHIINNSYAFLGIITLDLSNTFRLIGFLVTIIPFIHGAILTFSNKWYKHKITEKKYRHFNLS